MLDFGVLEGVGDEELVEEELSDLVGVDVVEGADDLSDFSVAAGLESLATAERSEDERESVR